MTAKKEMVKRIGAATTTPKEPRIKKKKKPYFNVLNSSFMKSVKSRWRKPRGVSNKKRIRRASTGASPRIGYRNPVSIRGIHPSGKAEIMIHNLNELQNAPGKIVRIASQVGAKKRALIETKAKEMGLDIINPLKVK
ncbi:MAG TPA: eL32 family ribosomal protein [Candidatus Bilamarchaeaceae archaeon]|nr:eL32 family ribosomal protein [Candidatus Bilamarchaeaceae archaeon]